MAFIPTTQRIVRCRVHWDQGTAHAENVFYLELPGSGAITTADCTNAADQVAHAYNVGGGTDIMDVLTPETVLTQIDVEEAAVQFGHHFTRTLSIPGRVSGGHAIAPGVALVVTLQTPFRGRSFRGRLFQIGAQEAAVDESGAVDGTSLAVYQTAFNTWLTALEDTAVIAANLGVVSYFSSVANPTPPHGRALAVFTVVTSLVVRPHVHSQRRRNRV